MNLFQSGNFTLNSGAVSSWKLECDALNDADWETLALMVRELVGPFGSVEGVPRGGLKLAAKLQPYCQKDYYSHLIVDDVLTTGGSMERAKKTALDNRKISQRGVIGAVVFARGPCPPWVKALFQMPEKLWVGQGR